MAHFEVVVTLIFAEIYQKGRFKSGNFNIENIDYNIKLLMSAV